jgi:hypothetical protein
MYLKTLRCGNSRSQSIKTHYYMINWLILNKHKVYLLFTCLITCAGCGRRHLYNSTQACPGITGLYKEVYHIYYPPWLNNNERYVYYLTDSANFRIFAGEPFFPDELNFTCNGDVVHAENTHLPNYLPQISKNFSITELKKRHVFENP